MRIQIVSNCPNTQTTANKTQFSSNIRFPENCVLLKWYAFLKVATYSEAGNVGLHIHYPSLHNKKNVNYLTACSHFFYWLASISFGCCHFSTRYGILHICYHHRICLVWLCSLHIPLFQESFKHIINWVSMNWNLPLQPIFQQIIL